MMMPTPHLDKINATIQNSKTPRNVVPRLQECLVQYHAWIEQLKKIEGTREDIIDLMVHALNEYKFYVDFHLIFLCDDDFLYRQKGQLKLDNSVIEEFLPYLVAKCFPELAGMKLGPTKCFSATYFSTSLMSKNNGGNLSIRTKDQDFAISRKLFLKSSHDRNFEQFDAVETYLGYVTAECKTNLDKTMFQEASATASDVKSALPGSKYFLLCDWLDMTPVSTAPTDIDEVLILRKAKRLGSNIRSSFNTYAGRSKQAVFVDLQAKLIHCLHRILIRFTQPLWA